MTVSDNSGIVSPIFVSFALIDILTDALPKLLERLIRKKTIIVASIIVRSLG